ncbi:hypothetical protein Droror1_Dr00009013 [Drosera rotundifolia]
MAAVLKLATLAILSCMVVVSVAPQASYATFIGYDWGTTFYWCCRDYIETGIDCALDYACCPVIAQFAGAFNKDSTKDELILSEEIYQATKMEMEEIEIREQHAGC